MTVTKERATAVVTAASSLAAINTGIRAVRVLSGKLNGKVQEVGLLILEHAQTHGDCTAAARLVREVPGNSNKSMLIGWFMKYSPVGVSLGKTATEDKCRFIRPESKNYHPFDIAAARANPWFTDPAKVEPEFVFSSLDEYTGNVYSMLSKKLEAVDEKVEEGDRANVRRILEAGLAAMKAARHPDALAGDEEIDFGQHAAAAEDVDPIRNAA